MIRLESRTALVEIAPDVGARITRFRSGGHEFLWTNEALPLRREAAGTEYDPNFYGGIDELLPNDVPERIAEVECPDHGEVWTAGFDVLHADAVSAELACTLPASQFEVRRRLELKGDTLFTTTRITNVGCARRPFLWKLHPALAILPGDELECAARSYKVADVAWSRRSGTGRWSGEVVPEFGDGAEFLYLHDLSEGVATWRRKQLRFEIRFDPAVFPYVWLFASYGGFDGHHVAILEPCTAMPISVVEADRLGQCSALKPGHTLSTTYSYRGWLDAD